MSLGSQIAWDDTVLPFQLDTSDIRGRVARLDGVLNDVLAQHDYPARIEALVAEAVMLTALIGQTIKLRWKLSLQIRGDGGARLIATDYFAPKNEGDPALIRAYASFDESRFRPDATPFELIGKGYFAVLIDQGAGQEPYQGITGLTGGSLAACAQEYFAQSEQIPTNFALTFRYSLQPSGDRLWRGGGIMVQHMPKGRPDPENAAKVAAAHFDDDSENWGRVNYLLDTVEDGELIGPEVQPTELLVRLFHEEGVRVFDSQPIAFGCSCSADRVRESLSIYSAKDIASMTTEEGIVTADCQFCGAHFEFEPHTLGFEAKEKPGDDS